MTWPGIESVAQLSVERVLNSLPEGLLIALFAWLLLRLIGRQNSGTRFAVWFMALIAVAGLSLTGGFRLSEGRIFAPASHLTSHITIPIFWAEVIFSVWAAAAVLALARVAVGLLQIRRIRRSWTETELSQLDAAIAGTLRQHTTGREIRLAVSERIKVPAAIGFWKPAIVLPAWTLRELTAEELNPILIHELTHLKRRDDWTNLFQKIVRAVFFFHPAVWWIDARLSLEREMACDDAVLASTGNPRAYASSLIDLLEKSCARRGWTMAQAAVHRARELSLRIAQILDAKRPASTRISKPALAFTGIFSLACFALSWSAPRLVSFAPEKRDAVTHAAEIKTVLHNSEAGLPDVRGAVVPASYHLPMPEPANKQEAVSHKPKPKKQLRTRTQTRLATQMEQPAPPQVIMTSTAAKQNAPSVHMVVFIESTCIEDSPATNQTQVWQILLIAPVQNAPQTGDGASII